jgi:diguanylate cyclase (GGDEF)-like protein
MTDMVLIVIAAFLPRRQGREWLREACGILAEVRPDKRALYLRSYIWHAPQIVWTTWSAELRQQLKSRTSKTGLLNAGAWERKATVQIARAVRTGIPSALALVDIDHFKVVNDTYGHLVRDKVLRAVTDALRNELRDYDLAGQFGEEGFALLLPHAREVDAINVAERLRAHIACMAIPVGDDAESGPCIKLTISIGVAALEGASRELTDMLAAADAALYYAKETGRNKTHVISASAVPL